MRVLLPLLPLALSACAALDTGPDPVPLRTDPPGATVTLRTGAQVRTMPGVTPMTIRLQRELPDPIEIEFSLQGYRRVTRKLFMQRRSGREILPRAEWRWPSEPIEIKLVPGGPPL